MEVPSDAHKGRKEVEGEEEEGRWRMVEEKKAKGGGAKEVVKEASKKEGENDTA